jgi:farnesyl diphosphate synthase
VRPALGRPMPDGAGGGAGAGGGGEGMVLGQALDIAAETAAAPLTLDQITALQAGKTGALIGWSARGGGADRRGRPAPLRRYATALGWPSRSPTTSLT